MTPPPYSHQGMKGRLLFVLTLWTALGVALLSALAPLGPPSSRLTGSAFNPATTTVILKARAPAAPVAARATEPDGGRRTPFSTSVAIWLFPVATLALAAWLWKPLNRFSRPALARKPRTSLSHRHARAPPVLS